MECAVKCGVGAETGAEKWEISTTLKYRLWSHWGGNGAGSGDGIWGWDGEEGRGIRKGS